MTYIGYTDHSKSEDGKENIFVSRLNNYTEKLEELDDPEEYTMVERSREFQRMRRDAEKAEQKLQERTIVERAKGVIMKARGISEDQAYVYIRTLSQNKSLPMKEIAELILSRSNTVQWQE